MGVTWIEWTDAIAAGVREVPDETLAKVAGMLSRSNLVVTAGNGGSACLASHAAQALLKPDYKAGGGIPAVCLTDGISTLTAHANDGGWASALEEAGRPFICRAGTTLLLFSSSGKSENICRLADLGRKRGCEVIAMTGFDGEPLKSLATVSIHISSRDYEVVEPVHDALLHRIQAHLRRR